MSLKSPIQVTSPKSLGTRVALPTVALLVAALGTGCASKGFVRTNLEDERLRTQEALAENQRQTQGEIESLQSEVSAHDEQIQELDARSTEISKTAQEALERAREAGKLAQGQFVSETLLTSDALTFGFERATIDDKGQQTLSEFARQLVENNESVYIEIQGHTDSSGPAEYNYKLGLERAEAVRRHLRAEHNIPLHRMEVISYGETEPIASNDDRAGRQQNRRVSLIVLK